MSSSRYVSRHASARRTRPSLPSIGGAGVARTAVKSVAGVGIVLGSGAFVIAPTSAIGSADADRSAALGTQQSGADDLLAERGGDTGSSRAAQRSAPAAISAPSAAKGADEASSGELDVEAVAKPKPEPTSKPTPEPAGDKVKEDAEDAESITADEADETEETTPAEQETAAPEQPDEASEADADESSESSTESSESSDGGAPETGNYAAEAAEAGLGPNAQQVYSAVRTEFPDMSDIGGYRAGDSGDHGSGNAVDVMVSGSRGDQVAAWVQQNAGSLNVTYVIWKQRIWHPGGGWEPMEDRGDPTQNHFDHVHVSVS